MYNQIGSIKGMIHPFLNELDEGWWEVCAGSTFIEKSYMVTIQCIQFWNKVTEILFKEKTKYSGIVPAEWNSVYVYLYKPICEV